MNIYHATITIDVTVNMDEPLNRYNRNTLPGVCEKVFVCFIAAPL